MRTKLVLLAFLAVLLGGCIMPTPRQKVFVAYETYKAAADLCVSARKSGAIESDATWAHIQRLDRAAYAALKTYEAAITNGYPGHAEWAAFNAALDRLLEAYQRLDEPSDILTPAEVS